MIRRFFPVLVLSALLPGPACAADAAPQASGMPPSRICVEVEISGSKSRSYDCVNQQLAGQADAARPAGIAAPVTAASPPAQTGGFDFAALSQQFGPNLGKSPQPYRPPAPVFANPLGRH